MQFSSAGHTSVCFPALWRSPFAVIKTSTGLVSKEREEELRQAAFGGKEEEVETNGGREASSEARDDFPPRKLRPRKLACVERRHMGGQLIYES